MTNQQDEVRRYLRDRPVNADSDFRNAVVIDRDVFERAYQAWREELCEDDPLGLPVARASSDSLFQFLLRIPIFAQINEAMKPTE